MATPETLLETRRFRVVRHSYRTRDGRPWTSAAVFRLIPRLIDVAPRILSGNEWESRKKQLSRVPWNS